MYRPDGARGRPPIVVDRSAARTRPLRGATVLMALGFVVAMITYGTGRTNLLSGVVHLVLLATYVLTVFAP